MKIASILIFLGIILSIHISVNYYIYSRGIQWLQGAAQFKSFFRAIMIILVIAYPLGRFLEKIWYSPIATSLHWIGAFWFAGMLYFTLSLITIDLIRLINLGFHFLPAKNTDSYEKLKLFLGSGVTILVLLLMLAGFINAWSPKTSRHTITINKSAGELTELRIVAVSDIHLGTIIGPRKTQKLVESINRLKPDIILLAGDIVDEDVQPVIKQNLGESLKLLKAPLGIYASTGNHEYIGGVERSAKYLSDHGLTLLRDSNILINDAFYIIGREDRDKNRSRSSSPRKNFDQLLLDIDKTKPMIVLDHQPFKLDEATKAGIDLQISGHTHHGQLWPINYITKRIFEVSRGYKQKGQSHFIVSTGFGTWGPPIRTGNRPEILEITLKFNP